MAVAARRILLVLSLLIASAVIGAAIYFAPPATPLRTPTPVAAGQLKLVVSVPHAGARRAQSDAIANAARLAVEQRNGRVTTDGVEYDVTVEVVDSAGGDGAWSEERERANFESAAADPRAIAYLGPSTAAGVRALAPLAERAGLVVITPVVTTPGIAKRGVVARVIPADDAQDAALLAWLKETGRVPVSAQTDAEGGALFVEVARTRGIEVVAASDPRVRFVYVAATSAAAAGERVAAVRRERPGATLGGSELLLAQAFLDAAKAAADGTVATFVGRPQDRYVGAAGEFFRAYRDRFSGPPDPYAIFGYDAARLALDAVRRGGGDRKKVRDAVFATTELRGALGTWGLDGAGETTYATTQLYLARALPDGSVGWTWEREITR